MAAKCKGSALGCLLLAGLLLAAGRELQQEQEDCIDKCLVESPEDDFPLCYAECPHGTGEEGGAGNDVRTTDCVGCCREYEGDASMRKRCMMTCSWKRIVDESGARNTIRTMDCAADCLKYNGDERKGCVMTCRWRLRVAGDWEKMVAAVLPVV